MKSVHKLLPILLCLIMAGSVPAQTLTAKDMADKVACRHLSCFDSLFVKRGFSIMPYDGGGLSFLQTVFIYKSQANVTKGKTDSLSRNYIELDLFNDIGVGNRLVFTTRSLKVAKKLLKSFKHEGYIKYSAKPNNRGNIATIFQNKNPYLELAYVEIKHNPEDVNYEFILMYKDR